MRKLLVAMIMLGWAGVAQAEVVTPQAVSHAAVVDVIRPDMLAFETASRGLDSAMQALCVAPSADGADIVAQEFAQVVAAYGRIDFLRIGPLLEDNRADRLFFWPDRRSIGLKQVQAILAKQDPLATDLETLQAKSVATQGLGALEFVLFGTGSESLTAAAGAFRCAYGQTITANIAQIAGDLIISWYLPGGIADHLQDPQPNYSDYRTPTEAMEALLGLVSHGLEAMRDKKLVPFIATDTDAAKPKLAPLWRSGLTMTLLRANVDGMRELVTGSGMALAEGPAAQGLGDSIDFEFRNAIRALDLVTLPVDQAVADSQQASALSYLALVAGSLQSMVGEQLSAALGLSVGFSSLDGD